MACNVELRGKVRINRDFYNSTSGFLNRKDSEQQHDRIGKEEKYWSRGRMIPRISGPEVPNEVQKHAAAGPD